MNEETLQLLTPLQRSIYDLARAALLAHTPLAEFITSNLSPSTIAYDEVYEGRSEWRILPAFDHPAEPSRCLVTGTGLTHKASADNRQAMHGAEAELTDSMRMYRWGLEGGRPAPGCAGVAPEWFYKGTASILRAHGEPLEVPRHAEGGGEEPEIAGLYIIDDEGQPRRVGMAMANEFSDHVLEKRNYLYLAPSKLRTCAIGPEVCLDPEFNFVRGIVSIERAGHPLWSKAIATGETHMCHTVANLEHHHFKYDAHRRPGDAHVHFFGADAFSFGDGIALHDGDVMSIAFEGFGRALRNPIRIKRGDQAFMAVRPI